jgi:uncharacterized membrane protein
MDNTQLDSFLAYVSLVEEDLNENQFTKEEIQKLDLIRSKVSDLLKRTQPSTPPASIQTQQAVKVEAAPVQQIVESFESFVVNEMIKKRGKKWVVLDKSGKKVLGTHPSREKAVKQLQAIEISKHG